jgi:glutathione S-transferase
MHMKLYYHPLSTYSQKVLIALYEKGLAFEAEIVNLMDDAARDAYRKIYPMGKIPLLVLDDGQWVPESSIICEYLDTHFDAEPKLIPDDRDHSRQVRFKDRMYDLYLNESVSALLFENFKPAAQRSQELQARCRYRIGVMYGFMEKNLQSQTWTNGETFTLGDCAAAPPLFYAQQTAPFADRPNIVAYWQRLQARPAVQRVLGEAAPYLARMQEQEAAAPD